jgi:hypothetical protein
VGSFTDPIDYSLNGTVIGTNKWNLTDGWFAGYIDEFHVIKKIAKWTGPSFTVPSAAYGAADIDTVLKDTDVSIPGFYCFMSQAAGYKMGGKTNPATVAPYRAEYDRGVADPCYANFEISWNQVVIKPIRLLNIMPPENNIGATPQGISYHPFTFTKT